ncbi:MAG: M14 metallopeptidase family protein [Tenuifilaceae bacterium]
MRKSLLLFVTCLLISNLFSQNITKPEEFFGFKPGADGMLFTYEKQIEYLSLLDKQSERLFMTEIGKSPLGKPMFIAFISSSENIKNLDRLKEINKRLAIDSKISDSELKSFVKEGKVFILATLSMHSSEVAPAQASALVAYDLVSSNDSKKIKLLDNVVLMIVPTINPDGMDMIVENFNKYKGTKYEGSSLPGVYHKYIGHDNNRDYLFLSQSDSRAISAITSTTWYPQVFVDKHQMGSTGPRYFVPPYHDPIAENVDAEIFTWIGLFGHNMVNDMTAAGLKGVTQNNMFDSYWLGSTKTCIFKNVIGFLNEAASAQVAKPIFVEPTELSASGKGLSEYKMSSKMVAPWPGGWWRLGDIVEYEVQSMQSILNTALLYKERILTFRNQICKKEVEKGRNKPPYYFIVPENQLDKSELVHMVNLLQEHGVEVYRLINDYTLENMMYKKGDIVVPLAQPFRSFVKEVMEAQKYPERHFTPDGELMEPYDITSWSLPLQKGFSYKQIDIRNLDFESKIERIVGNYSLSVKKDSYEYAVFSSTTNQSYKMVFDALNQGLKVERCEKDFDANGIKVSAGSFIIKKQNKLDEILNGATFPIIYLNEISQLSFKPVLLPRIGLIESNYGDMDAGWTRSNFDDYGIKFTVLRPGDFESLDIAGKYDVLVFPDVNSSVIKDGKRKRDNQFVIPNIPPEFTKGMDQKGFENLLKYINNGGIIVSWGASTALFEGNLSIKEDKTTEEFRLPFRNDAERLAKKGLKCPGSLIRMKLVQNHPITWGVPAEIGIYFRGSTAFTTSIPNFDMDRKVLGTFDESNLLLSGYLDGEKNLYNKSALIWLKKGKGQLVIFGFSPIFRSSVPLNYKLLYNALLLEKIK